MKVLKFGGTSVGSVESLSAVRKIVRGLDEPAVIVVSALGGLTDRLILSARLASGGDNKYIEEFEGIRRRHLDMIEAMLPADEAEEILPSIEALHIQLGDILRGVALIKSLPEQTLDEVVSFGERISSIIAAKVTGAVHFDSLGLIKTEKWFNRNIAHMELTASLIKDAFSNQTEYPVLMGGFISTDRDSGVITNLGRGGSDYTAAIIAATLDADSLEIWTDVDGFMTADPRIIKQAVVIPEMSFVESMELCTFGAKVIYPPTIYPVFHKNIPIKILNTFNPSAPGTLITDHPRGYLDASDSMATGISSLASTSLISINGKGIDNLADVSSRIFNALAKQGVRVVLVSQPELDTEIEFVVSDEDATLAGEILFAEFAPEIAEGVLAKPVIKIGLTTIAVVGENLMKSKGVDSRLLHSLRREGITPLASSSATSMTTISFVIESEFKNEALQLLHDSFFPEAEAQVKA